MNLHKHQLYLLEQHSESFKCWSAINRITNEGKSLIMKLGPGRRKSSLSLLSARLRTIFGNPQRRLRFYGEPTIQFILSK